VFEEAKKYFDRPAMAVILGDDLGRHRPPLRGGARQVGGDPQEAVSSWSRRTTAVLAALAADPLATDQTAARAAENTSSP